MNLENNTLVILTPGFPESEADTICLPMQQSFVRALKESYPFLNIIVLSFQYPYFKKTYQWFDTTVISFDGRNKGGVPRLLLRHKINATLKKIHAGNRISGILSFWYGECALVGKKFGERNHIKHFTWILGQDARGENKYPARTAAKADQLIALSDFLQDEFEKNHGIRPLHLIAPGIDSKQFNGAFKEKDIDILGAGSLIPLKRYEIFMEVIVEIKKKLPGIKVMLVGNGPEKEKLQSLVAKYALQENLILTGELSYGNVLQMMQRTKVFLHPSSYEGFSGVCLEALYGGAHVISFCGAMNTEIAQWHIVNNKDEMAQKAVSLLQNPDTLYECKSPFLINDTAKKMMELFSR